MDVHGEMLIPNGANFDTPPICTCCKQPHEAGLNRIEEEFQFRSATLTRRLRSDTDRMDVHDGCMVLAESDQVLSFQGKA
jgi:hypothetical protein